MKEKKILEIENLILAFNGPKGQIIAVDDVSFSLSQGEIYALVGESGSGKTSLCRAILGLHSSHASVLKGKILLDGHEITKYDDTMMRSVRGRICSMVFQDPKEALNPAIPIGKQIEEAVISSIQDVYSSKKELMALVDSEVDKLMDLVELPKKEGLKRQYPHQLSGGMCQKVVLAIALAMKPKLLICDEPTSSLDDASRDLISNLIKRISQKRNMSVLLVTHDLALAERMASFIMVMKDGKIVEEGGTEKIFSKPMHSYTKKLIGYTNYTKAASPYHVMEDDKRKPLVVVDSISKSFKDLNGNEFMVLDDFSMEVFKGEILSVIGPSGRGKSTLARCIAGISSPDKGDIRFSQNTNLQMIFQDSKGALNPRMTVEEIVTEPLMIKGMKKKNRDLLLDEILEQVEIDKSYKKSHPYELSGGQRQRIAIARALITKPDFIIADEPLSSLDVSIQAEIVHLLKGLQSKNNLTILLIAHNIPMVEHISDRIIKM